MLDDLAYIHERDVDDALGDVEKQGLQLNQHLTLSGKTSFETVDNVVHAGMGGSALPALLAQSWPAMSVPFTVVRNYDLPSWVNAKTLVICDSVSGSTEEILEALSQAEAKGAQIAIITCGGALQQRAEEKNHPLVVLPPAKQPRYAVLSNFKALLLVLTTAGVLTSDSVDAEIQAAGQRLEKITAQWRPDVPTKDNQAKQIAQELMGKSVVIYSGPKLFPAAYKWKISFNENAKQVAWVNQFPEFNHNEFIGWSKQPTDKPYAVIDLRSTLEHPQVQKRFEISARLLSGLRPEPIIVNVQGDTVLDQMLWASALGDFVSIYLALLNGLNPATVDLLTTMKQALVA
jgi:glucose/mannose-6-phosphate isomerase